MSVLKDVNERGEVNYAEREKRLSERPDVADCRRMGGTHAAYGWCTQIADWWPDEHKKAYREAYEEQRRIMR